MADFSSYSGNGRRLILLGLDGATFVNLRPWAEEGILPNFARILREGASGILQSTIPPTTPPAWTACITGKNPGKHGIFDFRDSPYRHRARPLISGASVRAEKIWHILNMHGLPCGILNVPITWPPEPVDSFMISGMMTPGPESEWASPPELKREVETAAGGRYFPDLDIAKYDAEEDRDALAFLADVEDCFERRRRAFHHLTETRPWRFFMAVFILPDRIQHLFWKYMDRSSELYNSPQALRLRDRIIRPYRRMDAFLGEILSRLDNQTDLLIVSDHGFGGTETWFNVNVWLQHQGLLRRARKGSLRKWLLYQGMLANDWRLTKAVIPGPIQSAIRRRIRAGRNSIQSSVLDEIDWTRTKAFFSGIPSQGIFLNLKGKDGLGVVEPGAEADAVRRQIKEGLLDLREPHSGEALVEKVWLREEIYEGAETAYAPDIYFKSRNYAVLGRSLFGDSRALRDSRHFPIGFHRPDGILLAYGGSFKRGGISIPTAQMTDIAPTALHALGLPVPDDMDGRSLTELFNDDYLRDWPLEFRPAEAQSPASPSGYTPAEQSAIQSRLKALGYED